MSQELQMKNYIDYNIDKYSIGYKNKKKEPINKENFVFNKTDKDYEKILANQQNLNNKNYKEEKNIENDFNDNFQRLNILMHNSQNDEKYKEIIKQKELIINGNK